MVNFPTSFDNNASLYLVSNNRRTRLTASINNSTLTIPVLTTSGFPTTGFISILSSDDIIETEAIKYTSINATNFFATTRGAAGTPALPHFLGNNVDLTVVADHHNPLKDAIIQLEQYLNVSGSENFLGVDDFGNVVVPRTLTVGRGSTFSFTTVTGSLTGNTGNFTTSLRSPAVSGTTGFMDTLNVSGNTIMRGNLTVTGTATLGTLVVTGTATATGTSRFIGNMSIDNQVTIGRPASADADFLTGFNDTLQTIPSASYTSAGVQTGNAIPGVEYFVLYQGHAGAISQTPEKIPDLRVVFGSTELGQYRRRAGATSSSLTPEGMSFAMNGFTVVTGTNNRFNMEMRATGSFISDTRVNALAIIAWPLNRFRRNTDYFYEVRNDSTFGSTLPTTFGNPSNVLLSTTFNIVETGDYLFFAMAETNLPGSAPNTHAARLRFSVDGIYQRTEFAVQAAANGGTTDGENLGVMNVVRLANLTKGNHTFTIEGASRVSTTASFRRPRIFLFRQAAVQQVQRTTNSSFISITNSGNYESLGLSVTYTPQSTEKVLIFSHSIPSRSATSVHGLAQLTNTTKNEIYRADSGAVGATVYADTTGSVESHVMLHLLPMVSGVPNTVTASGVTRPAGFAGTTTRWGFQAASGTGINSDLWMMSTTPTFDFGFEWVTISGRTATTDTLLGETIQASPRLTISGSPVATGTSNPLASLNSLRGFVTVTGAGSFHTTMSGQAITVSGEPPGTVPDPISVGTLNVSGSLTISGIPVSTGTNVPDPLNIGTLNATTALTISGAHVRAGASIPDPLILGSINATNSLTISGVPVATGIGVTSVNGLRNAVLVSGAGAVTVFTGGQTITISGNPFFVQSPVTIGSLAVTGSLTISGSMVPIITGTGVSSINTLQNHVTVAGTGAANVTTAGQAVVVSGNPAAVPDPLNIGTVNVTSSLTLSGVPVATGTNKAVVLGVLAGGNQTTNIFAGSHIRWDGRATNLGGGRIFLDIAAGTNQGKFTLHPGSTYEIFTDICVNFSGSSVLGQSVLAIRSETGDSTGCVSQLRTFATAHSGSNSGASTSMAIVTPAVPTKYEVRILSGTSVTAYTTTSYCRVREL